VEGWRGGEVGEAVELLGPWEQAAESGCAVFVDGLACWDMCVRD
jgi:hypothetical protein